MWILCNFHVCGKFLLVKFETCHFLLIYNVLRNKFNREESLSLLICGDYQNRNKYTCILRFWRWRCKSIFIITLCRAHIIVAYIQYLFQKKKLNLTWIIKELMRILMKKICIDIRSVELRLSLRDQLNIFHFIFVLSYLVQDQDIFLYLIICSLWSVSLKVDRSHNKYMLYFCRIDDPIFISISYLI